MRARRGLIAVTIAAALVACGGGDATSDGDGSDPSTDPTSATPDDGGTTAPEASGDDDFSDLITARLDQTWFVEYQQVGDGGDQVVGIANDPPNAAIVVDGEVVLVNNADGTFSCSGGGCQQMPGEMSMDAVMAGYVGPFSFLFNESIGGSLFVDVDESTDTIASRSARCVALDPSRLAGFLGGEEMPTDARIEVCIDAETGVMLRTLVTGDGETNGLEATTFATTVDGALFEVG